MVEEESVLVRRDGATLILAINRPQDQNRVTGEVLGRLSAGIELADSSADIRVVVLTGSAEYFCSGGRIDGYPGGTVGEQLGFAEVFTRLIQRMGQCHKPIVAAVEGDCTAGGMTLMAACDLAIASRSARFGYPEIQHGVFPILAMALAKDGIPDKVVFELAYSGRKIEAEEAKSYALVNSVVDPGEFWSEIGNLVQELGSRSPIALGLGRKTFYAMDGMSRAARIDYAHTMLTTLIRAVEERQGP